jgi:hypothetical protein
LEEPTAFSFWAVGKTEAAGSFETLVGFSNITHVTNPEDQQVKLQRR